MCLLFTRPPRNWKCEILATLLFAGAENTGKPWLSTAVVGLVLSLSGCWFLYTKVFCEELTSG
jgi:hypothetical protein